MRTPRPLSLVLVALALVTGAALPRTASAQQAPAALSTSVPGTLTASGTYSARVTTPGAGSFERAGTYSASVTFTAAVYITGVNILGPSGNYQASGPFTATVSASGVTPFVVTGTYTAAGTFSTGTFVSSGQWTLDSGGNASGTHNGGGTYNLSAMTVAANGQYTGTVTGSPRGPFSIEGPYAGNGSFTIGGTGAGGAPAPRPATDPLTSAITDLIGGIAGQAITGPVAATALEMRNTATPPAGSTAGTFATGSVAPSGVSIVPFSGTTAQLGVAVAATKAVSVSATVGGRMITYVVGAPSFVNLDFDVAFPAGLNGIPVIVKT